jgi:hypothetical protein
MEVAGSQFLAVEAKACGKAAWGRNLPLPHFYLKVKEPTLARKGIPATISVNLLFGLQVHHRQLDCTLSDPTVQTGVSSEA